MPTPVRMPQLGESVVEGTIGKWLKQVGDDVQQYEPLLEVLTDKVDTEVTATDSGLLLQILAQEGETVHAGAIIAYLGEEGESIPQPPPGEQHGEPAVRQDAAPKEPSPKDVPRKEKETRPERVTPVVKRMAAEHAIDLSQVHGTGAGGRITKKDLLRYIETRKAMEPVEQEPGTFFHEAPAEVATPVEAPPKTSLPPQTPATQKDQGARIVPLGRMRTLIAEHMVRSKQVSPHVTTVMEADLSGVVAYRQAKRDEFARQGIRLTYTSFFVQAVAQALRAHPLANSSFTEQGLLLHPDVNIGIAVALDDGLIVPVIRRTDEMSLIGLARAVQDLAERARAGALKPDDVQGGTFSITNHGTAGSLFATPIINQPQAAILGVGAIQKRVVVLENDALAVRPMVYLSLSFDHRILDGATADAFLAEIVKNLERVTP